MSPRSWTTRGLEKLKELERGTGSLLFLHLGLDLCPGLQVASLQSTPGTQDTAE